MIQPAAHPAVPGVLPFLGALPVTCGEVAPTPGFGAVLAIEAEVGTDPDFALELPTSPQADAAATAVEAAVLPDSGKTLPVAVPVEADADQATPAPMPTPARLYLLPRAAPTIEVLPQPKTSAAAPPPTTDAPMAASPDASPAPVAAPALAGSTAPPLATTPPELQVANPPRSAVAALPVPHLPITDRAAAAAPLTADRSLHLTPQSMPAAVTLSVVPPPIVPPEPIAPTDWHSARIAPQVVVPNSRENKEFEKPELNLSLSATALAPVRSALVKRGAAATVEPSQPTGVAAQPVRQAEVTAKALVAIEPILSASGQPAPVLQALPAPAAVSGHEQTARPLDFTQLVDRLVAARELVQPQAFQIAVQHGEFGPVQLRFQREGDGMSVALANADPDFARVVSAAAAPVLPPLSADTLAQSGPRAESQAQTAANTGGSAHNRGGSPERREDRHGPADNPAPARHGAQHSTARSGIFA